MTTILLIRHGESKTNQKGVFSGHINIALTKMGKEQARLTAGFVASNYKVDAVYSSDLKRAFYTGKCIAKKCKVKIYKDKRLREIFAGEWENQKGDDLIKRQDYQPWLKDIALAKPTGGETVKDLANRVWEAVNQIAESNPNKTIAITAHGTPIRAVQSLVRYGNISKMRDIPWVSNASVSVFTFDNGVWAEKAVSLDSHLNGLVTKISDKF